MTLDRTLQSDTLSTYYNALMSNPEIGGIKIRLGQSSFYQTPTGPFDPGMIELPRDADFYKSQLENDLYRVKLAPFEKFFGDRCLPLGVKQLAETILSHELGHAVDFEMVVRSEGGVRRAAEVYADRVDSEINRLPLGMTSTRAAAIGREGLAGFRVKGIDCEDPEERWQASLRANMVEYTQLGTESWADNFALGVLAKMYPRY